MNLAKSIIDQIRLLLDKPISTHTNAQIQPLLIHQLINQEPTTIPLLIYKNRPDLLLYLIQNRPVTYEQVANIVDSLIPKLLKIDLQDMMDLMREILSKGQFKERRKELGIEKMMVLVMRSANQELKGAILKVVEWNVTVLWKLGERRIVQDFLLYYIKLFLIHNIYLQQFASLLHQMILITSHQPQQQTNIQIINRLITLLNHTQNKLLYNYQNTILNTLALLLDQPNTIVLDFILLSSCTKTIQHYLYNKPTREQARKAQSNLLKMQRKAEEQNVGKMQMRYESKVVQEKPLLIENVIEKANEYRLNQHLWNEKVQSKIQKSREKSYLKKGNGRGGGKSYIGHSPAKSKIFDSKIQEMLNNCLSDAKDSRYFQQKKNKRSEILQRSEKLMNESKISQDKSKINSNEKVGNRLEQSGIEQDWQFIEISNLIDLAYTYKYAQ